MSNVNICCCCGAEMPDAKDHCYINFRYLVPGSDGVERVLVAVVCPSCAKDADDEELKFPVIEALTTARIIRMEHPEKTFTP